MGMKVSAEGVANIGKRFSSPQVLAIFQRVAQEKDVAAMIGQAIAENFDQEGPGWQPLKAQTIRNSVAKKLKKSLAGMTDVELLAQEAKARAKGDGTQSRQILNRKGILKASASMPYARGNIYKVEGTNIIWGTNLSYAAIHNSGGIINHPGTSKGFGIQGLKIKPHGIPIPKREFLRLSKEWEDRIYKYVLARVKAILLGGG